MPIFFATLFSLVALVLAGREVLPPPPPSPAPVHLNEEGALFATGANCSVCHNGVVTSVGEDVSIGSDWRATMMANAARDPYWQAAVRRETTDNPAAADHIEDKCATCHMPAARYEAHMGGGQGRVFANLPIGGSDSREAVLSADGVTCTVCHQIAPTGLGQPSSFTGGFTVDEATTWGSRRIFGPFATDRGRAALMQSTVGFIPTEANHIGNSELCASCHTLYTDALNDAGEVVGRLPEQVPYLEWQASAYPARGEECQSCHMPVVSEPVPVTRILGEPREEVSRHIFMGGNFFVLGMLNRFRDELGVEALPAELDRAQRRTVRHLETETAQVEFSSVAREEGAVSVLVQVSNLAGHKLPTAYPSRRAWIHLTVRGSNGALLFESGAIRPNGSIVGNDHDEDGSRYEPHHTVIERSDQVQIYEAIMLDAGGEPTTALLRGVRFEKDNRLLPLGLEKATASDDIAVRGAAREDPDFVAGTDQVLFRIPAPGGVGSVVVEATLRFQPIGYRWAEELRAYNTFETNRFVGYYEAMSEGSSVALASARVAVP